MYQNANIPTHTGTRNAGVMPTQSAVCEMDSLFAATAVELTVDVAENAEVELLSAGGVFRSNGLSAIFSIST